MLDYLIPIGMALVGIVVMMFIFQSISKADVSTDAITATRKPRSKKSQRPSRKYSEDVLDLATEQLIAREMARNPSGMITDSKSVAPQTLDSIRNRRQAKEESQHSQAPSKVTERQKQAVKDHGFKVVENSKNAPKQQQQQERDSREPEMSTSVEELDRKLSLFFKSNSSRKAKEVKPSEAVAAEDPVNRGHVVVKGDISKAKSW